MRVVVTSGAGSGHLGPLLPIVAALRARGDLVTMVVPSAAASSAGASGAEVVVSPPPSATELDDAWERFRAAPPAEASRIANGEIFGRLNTVAALPAVTSVVRSARPDFVLHEAADYAGVLAAVDTGIPHVQVAISFADAEAGSLRHAAVELERLAPGIAAVIEQSPYLTRFPEALDPSPYPSTYRYRTGGVSSVLASDGPPLVYVSFGTVAASVGDTGGLYRSALRALDGLDVRVLVTTGRGHRPPLGPLRPAVRVEEWADQDEVLAEAELVVCHGGSGTVLGALAHDVPVVAVPMFADQPLNARRIAAAGAGLVVERDLSSAGAATFLDADAESVLRAAIVRALGDDVLRQRAAEIGATMRAAPDVLSLLDDIVAGSPSR